MELLICERKLRHDGAGGNRLRIAEVLEMPLAFGASIADVRQLRTDGSAFAVNPMTGRAAELLDERLAVGDGGIHALDGVEILERDPEQREDEHQEQDPRSEEHTSELQSRSDLVCRLLLEKKK